MPRLPDGEDSAAATESPAPSDAAHSRARHAIQGVLAEVGRGLQRFLSRTAGLLVSRNQRSGSPGEHSERHTGIPRRGGGNVAGRSRDRSTRAGYRGMTHAEAARGSSSTSCAGAGESRFSHCPRGQAHRHVRRHAHSHHSETQSDQCLYHGRHRARRRIGYRGLSGIAVGAGLTLERICPEVSTRCPLPRRPPSPSRGTRWPGRRSAPRAGGG